MKGVVVIEVDVDLETGGFQPIGSALSEAFRGRTDVGQAHVAIGEAVDQVLAVFKPNHEEST